MADLATVAAQVLAPNATTEGLYCAVAITAGQAIYKNTSSQWALADADVVLAAGTVLAIATANAAAGQRIDGAKEGIITMGAGAAPVQGQMYVVSPNAGGVAPYSDLLSGDYVHFLGVGVGSNQIDLHPRAFGVVRP